MGPKVKKEPRPIFRSEDFISNGWLVVMRNVTTSTELRKGQTAQLVELGEEGLALVLPAGSCAEGHCLLLRFFDQSEYEKVRNSPRSVQDRALRATATTKVVGVEGLNDPEKMLVTLELQQFVEKEWLAFIKIVGQVQARVSGLVKRIKQ